MHLLHLMSITFSGVSPLLSTLYTLPTTPQPELQLQTLLDMSDSVLLQTHMPRAPVCPATIHSHTPGLLACFYIPLLPCVPLARTSPLLTLLLSAHWHMYSAPLLYQCTESHRLLTAPSSFLDILDLHTTGISTNWLTDQHTPLPHLWLESTLPAPRPRARIQPGPAMQLPLSIQDLQHIPTPPGIRRPPFPAAWEELQSQELCRGVWRVPMTV
jgi:hypothetical protein